MERKERIKTYSLALFEVLDQVGASEYIRHTRRHAMAVQEILLSIAQNAVRYITGYTHVFGSAAEGTSTPGLQSDIDTVVSAAEPAVVEHLDNTNAAPCFLMTQDDYTPPGYTKLLLVEDGTLPPNWITRSEDEATDMHGRPVLKNKSLIDAMTYDERNGPAGTTLKAEYLPDLDYVPAFRSKRWPSQASDWLKKQRPFSFPSANVPEDFKKYGFFVVPVGHPSSAEKALEWRISFSIQERKMMSGLNPVQFKCYLAMKMIKHDFIKPQVEGKSLTSYHCKTCLFYTLEQTNLDLFTPDNFIACLMKCLATLVNWLTKGFLPNYFIPEENMWKGSKASRLQAAQILRGLLNDSPDFLTGITCDYTGQFLLRQVGNHDHGCGTDGRNVNEDAQTTMVKQRDEINETENEREDKIHVNKQEETEKASVDEDSVIADTIAEVLNLDRGNGYTLEELRALFPGVNEIVEQVKQTLTEDKTESASNDAHILTSKDQGETEESVDEMESQQQRKVDITLYKWHYWAVDYVFKNAKDLIETTIDKRSLDHCIEMHRELLGWLDNITDLSPRMEFSKLDFQIIKQYLYPFIFTSLGSQLAAKAIIVQTEDGQQYIEESKRLLEMGHSSDALSGQVKHAGILYMQGDHAIAENMLNDLDDNIGNHVATWGRCYRKVDSVHEVLCSKVCEQKMSTQEIVQEGVAACVTYLPTEIDLVPTELKYEMYRSVFATTPRDEHRESWFDFAVVDAKVYMFYLLFKIYVDTGEDRSQNAKLLFLIMTLEHELNLGHPETARNLLGCMYKIKGHLDEAWEAFAESWMMRPDHNAAKWHMCIMIAEAVAQLQNRSDESNVKASDNYIEVLYQRTN